MYRRPKFLEILHEIREQMSREANYDAGAFADLVRNNPASGREESAENNADAARDDGQVFKDRESETEDRRRRRRASSSSKIVYGNRF
jgi:hypothetical protein